MRIHAGGIPAAMLPEATLGDVQRDATDAVRVKFTMPGGFVSSGELELTDREARELHAKLAGALAEGFPNG